MAGNTGDSPVSPDGSELPMFPSPAYRAKDCKAIFSLMSD